MANKWRFYVPNLLTFSRGLWAVVAIVIFIWRGPPWLLWTIFNIAAITDFFDGHLARLWGVESKIGRIIDPLFDKLLIWSNLILVYLATFNQYWLVFTVILISRDLLIDICRWIFHYFGHSVAAIFSAKVKTTFQIIFINVAWLYLICHWWFWLYFSYMVVLITIYYSLKSAVIYFRMFKTLLKIIR